MILSILSMARTTACGEPLWLFPGRYRNHDHHDFVGTGVYGGKSGYPAESARRNRRIRWERNNGDHVW